MNRFIRPFVSSVFLFGCLALPAAARAQQPASLGDAIREARQVLLDIRAGLPAPSSKTVEPALAAESEPAANIPGTARPRPRIIGTWVVHVPGADPSQDFDALQTFGADGTFVETSSLLGTLAEGPAHGVWEQTANGFLLTFQLFAFDEEGHPAGMIRVRCRLSLPTFHTLHASTVVDVLPPGEPAILGVASGDYTGTRLTPVAP